MTTTTREAALEAALQEILSSDSYESRETFDGSNKHVVITKFGEFGQIAHDALATPATEPQGYVEGMREAARIVDERYAAGEMGNPGHHIIQALAARPAPQPAADTRVVTDAMIVKIWGLAQQYDPDEMFIELVRAIIGTATPSPSDKIAEAAQDKTAAELVIDAYDAANPFRQADMHPALCHCNRCAIDWLRALAGKGE